MSELDYQSEFSNDIHCGISECKLTVVYDVVNETS